jgi:hypothetical protein
VQEFVSFQQDLLVIGKTEKEAVLSFAGFYTVRAGCLLCMLGQTVPAEEFIPDGAGISRPYTLFPEIYFPFECKPVPQFLLPRAVICSIFLVNNSIRKTPRIFILDETVGIRI